MSEPKQKINKTHNAMKEAPDVIARLQKSVSVLLEKDTNYKDFTDFILMNNERKNIPLATVKNIYYGYQKLSNAANILKILSDYGVNINYIFSGYHPILLNDNKIQSTSVELSLTNEKVPMKIFALENNKLSKTTNIISLPNDFTNMPNESFILRYSGTNFQRKFDIQPNNYLIINTKDKQITEDKKIYIFVDKKDLEDGVLLQNVINDQNLDFKMRALKVKINAKDYIASDDNDEETDTLENFYNQFDIIGSVSSIIKNEKAIVVWY